MRASGQTIVVIPVYKQPALLVEAVDSVLSQTADFDIRALIVDDGCPFAETRSTGLNYARAAGGRVVYLRRRNGGLSAARNFGLEHALGLFPDFGRVFFLDADNRLAPGALARMAAALDAADPEVGWVYPDVDTFGLAESWSTAGEYSVLAHLRENYCEAGSLVSRRVVDAGVRFDETMRRGFEDWDFWLQAAARGFRGLHVRDGGFRYRRRAESMLSGAERSRAGILAAMRDKHAALLQTRSLLRLEEREAPRFLMFEAGAEGAGLFVDPRRRRSVDIAQAGRLLARARRSRAQASFPGYFVFSAPGALDRLARARLDRTALWRAQRLLEGRAVVAVRFAPDAARLAVEAHAVARPDALAQAALLILRTDAFVAAPPAAAALADAFGAAGCELVCRAPGLAGAPGGLADYAQQVLQEFAGAQKDFSAQNPEWRREWRQPRAMRDPCGLLEPIGPALPLVAGRGRPQVGFVLPLVEFGGVEKVVLNYARIVRDSGCDAHLFVIRENEAALAGALQDIFASVAFIDHEGARADAWDRIYACAGASNCARDDFLAEGLGLLAAMDVVLNTHALAAHSLMAGLRRQGVRTYVGLHLVELSACGHPMGSPNVALAFEHVYDGFLVISRQLQAWCAARGVPAEKILLAPNAPSYAADPEAIRRALARKASRARGDALRVLFLGRLDSQKGLDRLERIVAATAGRGCLWRVIGRAVLDGADAAADSLAAALGKAVEPPAEAPAALDEAYGWADAFVLPSRFEGAPLTILEAQRFGCIPLATRVGAVEEMIEDGVDGFLLDGQAADEAIVEAFAARLLELAGAPERVLAMARAGAERQAHASWRVNLRDWLAHALPVERVHA